MVRQAVPCNPWRFAVEQIPTCSLWKGHHTRAGGCPETRCDPVESLQAPGRTGGPIEGGV